MFNKKHRNCIMIMTYLLATIITAGCTGKDPSRYYNKEENFSIKLPEKWERQEKIMGTAVIALSPIEGNIDTFRENINIVVENLPKIIPFKEYIKQSEEGAKKVLTDYKLIQQNTTTINGITAQQQIFTHKMGQINIKGLAYILLKDKKAIIITCSADPQKFSKYQKIFEESATSFKFE